MGQQLSGVDVKFVNNYSHDITLHLMNYDQTPNKKIVIKSGHGWTPKYCPWEFAITGANGKVISPHYYPQVPGVYIIDKEGMVISPSYDSQWRPEIASDLELGRIVTFQRSFYA